MFSNFYDSFFVSKVRSVRIYIFIFDFSLLLCLSIETQLDSLQETASNNLLSRLKFIAVFSYGIKKFAIKIVVSALICIVKFRLVQK